MVPQPWALAMLWALMASVTLPIWLTLRRSPLQAFFSMAVEILLAGEPPAGGPADTTGASWSDARAQAERAAILEQIRRDREER